MNTKAIVASTLLTALFAGTPAMADDIGFDVFESFKATSTESVVMQKVNFQATAVDATQDIILSGQR